MSFSSAVMFFSKFVCSGIPAQGPSKRHLQPVYSSQPDPLGAAIQRPLGGGGDTQLLRASRESHPAAVCVQRQTNPSHFPFLLGKLCWGWGGQLEEAPSANTWVERMEEAASRPWPHLDRGHIQTWLHLDPGCSVSREEVGEKQSPAGCFRRKLCFPSWHPLLLQSCGLHLSLFSCGNTAFKAVGRAERGDHDIIASLPFPPATQQLLTKWEIPSGLL